MISLFLAASCTHSLTGGDVAVKLHPTPYEDSDYFDILKQDTRSTEVYDNFETKFHIHATYLSPQFRRAFDKRLTGLMKEAPFSLGEASSRTGFFISVFAPEDKKVDLNNQNLWTISMKSKSKKYFPTVVRSLSDKERWKAFFSHVNKWSKEFIIMFDAPSITPQSPDLLAKDQLELLLSNADASVTMTW
ncbi:MAG: hypothetical protein HRU09_16070 [Oligoflexales bacterium]|nr:hypothetical protein [Oligoflexales bacterium]